MKDSLKAVLGGIAAVFCCMTGWSAHEITNDWCAAYGSASEAANYRQATLPSANGLVRIGNGGTMQVSDVSTWGALWVGSGSADGSVVQTAGTMTLQEPGTASGDGTLRLGDGAGRSGIYSLEGGTLNVAKGNPQIGVYGNGALVVSGGTFRSVGYPSVGRQDGASGHLVQTGGILDFAAASQLTVGESGCGVLTLSGGAANVKRLVVGANATGSGLVNLGQGAVLTAGAILGGKSDERRFNAVGGTLRPQSAAAVGADIISDMSVSVGAGGLVVDTAGKNVSVSSSLVQSRLVVDNMAHRWSFNGNLKDAVGGQDATAAGDRADAVAFSNGEVLLPGLGKHQVYIQLGAGVVPPDLDGVTVELWATPEETRSWSRVFTAVSAASAEGAQSLYLSWTSDMNVEKGAFFLKANGETLKNNTSDFAPLVLGREWHFAFVFEKSEGGWNVTAQKRDPLTGFCVKTVVFVSSDTWDPSSLFSGSFNLGYSMNDADACARYDEVRVWKIALSESELLESAMRGPDADFATPPALRKTGEGTLAVLSAATYSGATIVEGGTLALTSSETPLHRWSFENGSFADSVAAKDGVATGAYGGNIAGSADGKGVELPGATHGQSYLALGKGLLPSSESGFTLELWATLRTARTWSRIFTFADDANANGLFMTWVSGTDNTKDVIGFRSDDGKTRVSVNNKMAPYAIGTDYHLSVVCKQIDGIWSLLFFKQNASDGTMEKTHEMKTPDGWTPARLANCALNLGWSPDTDNDDAQARYDEVRIWNRAFTEEEVMASGFAGPDRLPYLKLRETESAGSLPVVTDLIVDDGATFALGGIVQTVRTVLGGGCVCGAGTLYVSEGICPGGRGDIGSLTVAQGMTLAGTVEIDVSAESTSDSLIFAAPDVFDVSKLHLAVSNPMALDQSKRYTVIRSEGAVLTGTIDESALPSGWHLNRSNEGFQLRYRHGLIFMVR